MSDAFSADIGRQQFLQLLVTQIQHQDPLQPVGQQEFIQQLAQFSLVEGVEELNVQFGDMLRLQELTDGSQLVGRTVRFESAESDALLEGRVTEVRAVDGEIILQVGESSVPLDQIQAVVDDGV